MWDSPVYIDKSKIRLNQVNNDIFLSLTKVN